MVNSLDRYTISRGDRRLLLRRTDRNIWFFQAIKGHGISRVEHAPLSRMFNAVIREFRFGSAIFTGRYCISRAEKSTMIYKYKCQRPDAEQNKFRRRRANKKFPLVFWSPPCKNTSCFRIVKRYINIYDKCRLSDIILRVIFFTAVVQFICLSFSIAPSLFYKYS